MLMMMMLDTVDASLMKTAADSLLPIVQSQRERFRVRAQELETVRHVPTLSVLWHDELCVKASVVCQQIKLKVNEPGRSQKML